MPPLPPGPATGEELVTALTRKFKPEMVAELLELVSAGEITRAVLSQLTDIEIERIPDSSPAQVGARQGSHMAKAATRTRSGSYPLTPRNHDQ
jgi:precorrin-6B methylase 1